MKTMGPHHLEKLRNYLASDEFVDLEGPRESKLVDLEEALSDADEAVASDETSLADLSKTKLILEAVAPKARKRLLKKVTLSPSNPHFLSHQMVRRAKQIFTNVRTGRPVGFQAPMMWGKTGTLVALAEMMAPDFFIYCPFVRDKEFLEDNRETFKRHGIDNVLCLSLYKLEKYWSALLAKYPNIKGFFFDECHYGTRTDSVADKVISLARRDLDKPYFVFVSATPVQAILATLDENKGAFGNMVSVHEEGGGSYNGISDLRLKCEIDHQTSISFLEKNPAHRGQCVLEGEKGFSKQWSSTPLVRRHVEHLLSSPPSGVSFMAVRKANRNVSKSGKKVAVYLNKVIQREYRQEIEDGLLRVITACDGKTGFEEIDDEFLFAASKDIRDKVLHALGNPFCRTLILVVDSFKAGKNFGASTKERVVGVTDAYKNVAAVVQGLPGRLCMHNRKNWNIVITCNAYALECFEKLCMDPQSIGNGDELLNLLETDDPDQSHVHHLATGVVAIKKKPKNSIQEFHWLALPVCPTRYDNDGSHIQNYAQVSGINDFLRNLPHIKSLAPHYSASRRQMYCSAESPFGTERDIFKAIMEESSYGGEIRARNTFDSYFRTKTAFEIKALIKGTIEKVRKGDPFAPEELEERAATVLSGSKRFNQKISDDAYVQTILDNMKSGPFADSNLEIKTLQDLRDLHFEGRLCQVCISRPRLPNDPSEPISGEVKSDSTIFNKHPS